MVDFHDHILPNFDDGSEDYDMSSQMLEIANMDKITNICATPHFIPNEHEIKRNEYEERLESLRKICSAKSIPINIFSGLEVYINPNLPKMYKEKKIWGLNDTKYLLIELPMKHYPMYTESVIYELKLQGIVPVLAHPERNARILSDKSILPGLIENGVLTQVNAGSFKGLYGKHVKEFAEYLAEKNMIHLLGTDAHNNCTRVPELKCAYETIHSINSKLYDWIISNEHKVLEGQDVIPLEINADKKKMNFFSFINNKFFKNTSKNSEDSTQFN